MRAADQRVLRLAERQYSLITRAQATSYGLSEDEVDGRLARAEWIRLYRSVYKIAGSPRRARDACSPPFWPEVTAHWRRT